MIDYAELKRNAKAALRYEWTKKRLGLGDKFPPDYENHMVGCSPSSILALIDENEALRKNSERYQFLKNLPDDEYLIERLECATDPENWDAAIDRAMSKKA